MTEDAASVLEYFINDVANLPNEIAHIFEEIQAKDKQLLELQKGIQQRDGSLQKFVKINGSNIPNPKEEAYSNHIRKAYQQIQILQDEKIAFAQKAQDLMDRHIKRLDAKIKDLQAEGLFPNEPITLPFNVTNLSAAAGSFAQAPSSYFQNQSRAASRRQSPAVTVSHGRSNSLANRQDANSTIISRETGPPTPGVGPGGNDYKRRRIGTSAAATPSNTAGLPTTPGAPASTVLSRTDAKPVDSAVAPPTASRTGPTIKRRGTHHKRRHPSQQEQEEEEEESEEEEDEEDEDEEAGEDKRLYCYCQQVSWGNMVACDDADCKYEWFHWGCVSLTKEPPGKWYCDACRERREKVKTARSS